MCDHCLFLWGFNMNDLKQKVAQAALAYIQDCCILGIGTGSTVNFFIDALVPIKHRIDACVASSVATAARLRALGISVIELPAAEPLALYIDGADEVTHHRQMIKGAGGAFAREKVIATAAREFICLVDASKHVNRLGQAPVPVEVLPLARSLVARALVQLGGDPVYRQGYLTDNGNIVLDVFNLNLDEPSRMEDAINVIPGVLDNGLFAKRPADRVLVATTAGIQSF